MKLKENTLSPDSLQRSHVFTVQNKTQHAKESRVPNKHSGIGSFTFWMLNAAGMH